MLKLIITLLPLLPALISDIDAEVEAFKTDADAATKASGAQQALSDLGSVIAKVIAAL